MSGQAIRNDKTCLNCRAVVEKKFCPECGQKNTESRQSFVHLFTHFFEDFTHYDNAFWKTMRHLLFKPAVLTKEYLAGRRQKYVPPVRLYIFISFVTFFLISLSTAKLMKDMGKPSKNTEDDLREVAVKESKLTASDSIKVIPHEDKNWTSYKDVEDLEKQQKAKPESERLNRLQYSILYRILGIERRWSEEPLFKREVFKVFLSSLPKILFVYMPVFAFVLWLFHGKRRWYYFDHGIFTLHYFSMLLLTISIMTAVGMMVEKYEIGETINNTLGMVCFFWWIFYFYRAHSRMYGEKKWISRLKSSMMFFINSFLIIVFLMLAMLYTAYSV